LLNRSPLLGDSMDPEDEGNPAKWKFGGPGNELDVLVVVAGDDRRTVTDRAVKLSAQFLDAGALIMCREDGHTLQRDGQGHEHFGFADGISQPGIRGRDAKGNFITPRYLDPAIPEYWLYGYPGQDLVWPGEFVLGYPKTGPDPLLPGPADPPIPSWTRNGSFMVFRRLRQDVRLFWKTMRETAKRLAKEPGFAKMDHVRLASLLVGRWPSGAPVNRTPQGDNPGLGGNPYANNHFLFDSDTPALPLANGKDPFPQAKADPVGTICPWAAHIRKVNTRDSASDMGGRESTYNRRLLRVGIPFGERLDEECLKIDAAVEEGRAKPEEAEGCDAEDGNRGLLFMSIQSSIDQQFEFLMSRWANDPTRPKMPGGHDMVIGQKPAATKGRRQCVLFGSGSEQEIVATEHQWVIPTGGGYFFMPSISALRDVIAM
jgi:Dyp-type peroxidase family